jgi:hypothetical protein
MRSIRSIWGEGVEDEIRLCKYHGKSGHTSPSIFRTLLGGLAGTVIGSVIGFLSLFGFVDGMFLAGIRIHPAIQLSAAVILGGLIGANRAGRPPQKSVSARLAGPNCVDSTLAPKSVIGTARDGDVDVVDRRSFRAA